MRFLVSILLIVASGACDTTNAWIGLGLSAAGQVTTTARLGPGAPFRQALAPTQDDDGVLVLYGSVALEWDMAVSHTNLQNYSMLVGVTPGNYTMRYDVAGDVTNMTITNLTGGGTRYYFACVARENNLDSIPSNLVIVDLY